MTRISACFLEVFIQEIRHFDSLRGVGRGLPINLNSINVSWYVLSGHHSSTQ